MHLFISHPCFLRMAIYGNKKLIIFFLDFRKAFSFRGEVETMKRNRPGNIRKCICLFLILVFFEWRFKAIKS